ncbi:hypothetical protein [Pontibacter flavimaris]|uniref:Uncharacterized protein n=1 Tax=Pontibacter flavimaris TaxID=1797110 RepID=A0A1Q5PFB8_9BACT|nr:hypothetical protein [Pontibacter flavimaris]OKL40883.1 hypothetical protein A3841_13635 [Pontibacter flavimaris]
MNKNVTAVFAAACGMFMASCGAPSDLRPEEKVSIDTVEPGTRKTYNVSDAGTFGEGVEDEVKAEQVMPNHDAGANSIQPGDSVKEKAEINSEAGAVKR